MKFNRLNQYERYLNFLDNLKEIVYSSETVPYERIESNGERSTGYMVVETSLENYEDVKKQAFLKTINDTNYLNVMINLNIGLNIFDTNNTDVNRSIILDNAIKLPVCKKTGMKLNGLRQQFLNEYSVGKGWQIERKNQETLLTYRPDRGGIINFKIDRTGQKSKFVAKYNRKNYKGAKESNKVYFSILLKAFSDNTDDNYLISNFTTGSNSHFYLVPPIDEFSSVSSVCNKSYKMVSESVVDCKREVINLLTGVNQESLTPSNITGVFERRIAKSNRFKLTPAMYKRAKRYFSFTNRCLNKTLSESIRINDGTVYDVGTILTNEICNKITESGLTSIKVEYDGVVVRIVCHPISEYLDINHLYNIANIYCCELDGVRTVTDLDSTENKTIANCYTVLHEYTVDCIDEILDTVEESIRYNGEILLNNILLDKLKFDFSSELGPDSYIKNIRGINPRNTLSLSIVENQVTADIKNYTESAIEIKDIARGFLDSPASPDSKKAGITQNIASTTYIDKNGEMCNTFCKLKDGVITGEEVDLTISEAFNNKIVSELFESPDDLIYYMYQGKRIQGHVRDADYCYLTPTSVSSRWAACGVGFEHNKSRRTQMAENQNNQYHMILGAEKRLFTSGISSTFDTYVYRYREIVKEICIMNGVFQEDEYIEAGIKLIKIVKGDELIRYTFKSLSSKLTETVEITVDYMATISQMLWSYELNTSLRKELIWYDNEIVIKPLDVDTRPTSISDLSKTNFGAMGESEIVSSVKEMDLAMGLNLLSANISLRGTCYEDGNCIRQGLVDSMRLANIYSHKITIELDQYDVTSRSEEYKLNEDGLPKLNEYYYDNEVILEYKTIEHLNKYELFKNDMEAGQYRRVIKVPEGAGGFVQDVRVKSTKNGKREIIITIASLKQYNISDKLTGHHGDKGVTTYIVPDSMMPTLANGTPVDICFNPLGIPSRMNMGVLVEGKGSSYSLVQNEQKPKNNVIVKAPFDNTIELVENIDKLIGSSEEVLYDPETLRPYANKITTVYRYVLKLDHNVEKKIAAISTPQAVDTKTKQPKKSKFYHGGQSLSELGLVSLLANGATKVVDYLTGAGSDDTHAYGKMKNDLIKKGQTNIIGSSKSVNLTMAYLNSIGYTIKGDSKTGITISLATDNDIEDMSIGLERQKDKDTKWYLKDNKFLYEKPRRNKRTNKFIASPSDRTFTHINCGMIAWVNPSIFNSKIIRNIPYIGADNRTRNMSQELVEDILANEAYVSVTELESTGVMETGEEVYYTLPKIYKNVSDLRITVSEGLNRKGRVYTGAVALYVLFKNLTKEDILKFSESRIGSIMESKKRDSDKADESIRYERKRISIIKNLPDFNDLITNKFLILPYGYRFISKDGLLEDEMNGIYRVILNRLLNIKNPEYDMLTENVGDFIDLDFVKKYNEFYKCIYEMYTKSKFEKSALGRGKKVYKTPINFIDDKEIGSSRGYVFSKKIRHSFRSVIVGRTECKLDEFFIPRAIAYEVYKPKIIYWLANDQRSSYLFEGDKPNEIEVYVDLLKNKRLKTLAQTAEISYKEAKEVYELVFNVVKDNLRNELCVLVREPALIKDNTQAFTPILWEEHAIGINTLICEGYNADFDGDQMAGYALLPEPAKEDAREHLMPYNLTRSEQNGELAFSMKMDIVLGFKSATVHEPDLANVIEYNNLDKLEYDFKHRLVKASDTVHVKDDKNNIDCISTVGRAYSSLKLPYGIGIIKDTDTGVGKFLIDKEINSSDLKTICNMYADKPTKEIIIYLNMIKTLGFELQDLENVSLGLDDFTRIYKSEIYQKTINNIDTSYLDSRKETLELAILEGCVRDVTTERQNLLRDREKDVMCSIKKALPKDSNLSKILTSGARGSMKNFLDTMIHTGYVKGVGEKYSESPILNSLYHGYTPDDYFTSGHESRRSSLATNKGTADSGELNRIYGFDMGDEIIGSDNCGAEPTEHALLLELDLNSIDLSKNLYGKKVSTSCESFYLFGTKILDVNCIDTIKENLITSLELDDGTSVKFNYLTKDDSYKLYCNRWGYRLRDDGSVDTSVEVELKKSDIDEYVKRGRTHIFVRLTWDCKEVGHICKKCFGRLIANNQVPKTGTRVGHLTSTTVARTMVQLALDTKNARSDSDSQTSVTKRLKKIVTLAKGSKRDENYAVYTNQTQLVKVDEDYSTVLVNKTNYHVNKSRILVGSATLPGGIKVIDGELNYFELDKILPIEKIRELMFNEFFYLYESNGVELHPKHFEIVVLAQTRFAIVTSLNNKQLSYGSIRDKNELDELVSHGQDIEYRPCVTSLSQSCLASGWTKAISFGYVFDRLADAVNYNYIDKCTSTYSSIALGKSLSEPVSDISYEDLRIDVKMDRFTSHIRTAKRNKTEEGTVANKKEEESIEYTSFFDNGKDRNIKYNDSDNNYEEDSLISAFNRLNAENKEEEQKKEDTFDESLSKTSFF